MESNCSYVIKFSTGTSASYFNLSSIESVKDFLDNNLVVGTKIELTKLK